MKISVIIPCYNEKNTLEILIDKVKSKCNFEHEIIVVDDFSEDGSREILNNISNTTFIVDGLPKFVRIVAHSCYRFALFLVHSGASCIINI